MLSCGVTLLTSPWSTPMLITVEHQGQPGVNLKRVCEADGGWGSALAATHTHRSGPRDDSELVGQTLFWVMSN